MSSFPWTFIFFKIGTLHHQPDGKSDWASMGWDDLVGGDWNHGIPWLSRNSWEFHHPNWLSLHHFTTNQSIMGFLWKLPSADFRRQPSMLWGKKKNITKHTFGWWKINGIWIQCVCFSFNPLDEFICFSQQPRLADHLWGWCHMLGYLFTSWKVSLVLAESQAQAASRVRFFSVFPGPEKVRGP